MLIAVICLYAPPVFAQTDSYILNGSAVKNSCNCYTLTPAQANQGGSVWNANKINLNNPFDFTFNIMMGCSDDLGADGIVFMLQPFSTSLGASAEGMGFSGISPSIGISIDTWQNTNLNDPPYDHISIQANGVITHGSDLAGPATVFLNEGNIEDCQTHEFRVRWNPATHDLEAYIDGELRVEATIDLVAGIFNNDPMVYWGFSGATGGAYNLQQFCTKLNPSFNTNLGTNTVCLGFPVIFQNLSESFTNIVSYYWDFGDGTYDNTAIPPPHYYASPGTYLVRFAFTAADGCNSDTVREAIVVGAIPAPTFEIKDTCQGMPPRIIASTQPPGGIASWQWILDGVLVASGQNPNPVLPGISGGPHIMQLVVVSSYGCRSDTVTRNFFMKPGPVITAQAIDGCLNTPLSFSGTQIDNATTISQWKWLFGDGQSGTGQSTTHIYTTAGDHNIKVWTVDNDGCLSDTFRTQVHVNDAYVFAGNDTIVIQHQPHQLNAVSPAANSYTWSPPRGLSSTGILNPVTTLQDDVTYILRITTPEGCEGADTINIQVFKGSFIYVPSGFTPNGDGLNDLLRVRYIGIKKLSYFTIFNRWGQMVYTTKQMNGGWDGNFNGKKQQGTFVWVLHAEDIQGKQFQIRGTITVIR